MQALGVLFVFVLFSGFASGLKCYECSNLSGGKPCSILRKSPNKDCSQPISKNERSVCKSSWKEGFLYISECSVTFIKEENGCCIKGGPVNNRTICTCDKDYCITNPAAGNEIINRCKKEHASADIKNDHDVLELDQESDPDSGLKCYNCDSPNCKDLTTAPTKICPAATSDKQKAVCRSNYGGSGQVSSIHCGIEPITTEAGCCLNFLGIECNCDTDLCLDDGKATNQCPPPPPGLICHTCEHPDCKSYGTATASKQECLIPHPDDERVVCQTIWLPKLVGLFEASCGSAKLTEKTGCCNYKIGTHDTIKCICDEKDLCVNNGLVPVTEKCQSTDITTTTETIIAGMGLRCYVCDTASDCRSLTNSKKKYCGTPNTGEKFVCSAEWYEGKRLLKASCESVKIDEKTDCCDKSLLVGLSNCTCATDSCNRNEPKAQCDPYEHEKAVCISQFTPELRTVVCTKAKIDEKTECCKKIGSDFECKCTTDLCIGDGHGDSGHTTDCSKEVISGTGLRCFVCNTIANCKSLTNSKKKYCGTPNPGEKFVCRSEWFQGDLFKGYCDSVKIDEKTDCCDKSLLEGFTNCTCATDNCNRNKPKVQCDPNQNLQCYFCDNKKEKTCPTATKINCPKVESADGKAVCTTLFTLGFEIRAVKCSAIKIEEKTECCTKYEGKGTLCRCTTDLCIGDGKGGNGHTTDCSNEGIITKGIKCYECGFSGQSSCAYTPDEKTYSRVCAQGQVCYSKRELSTIQRSCYSLSPTSKLKIGECVEIRNRKQCICDTDLCIGDGKGNDVSNPDEVCFSLVSNGEIVRKGCYSLAGSTQFQNKKCTLVEQHLDFRDGIVCFCNKDLCLGDGNGDEGFGSLSKYGITCYSCERTYEECKYSTETTVCPPNHGCLSVINPLGTLSRSCFDLALLGSSEGNNLQLGNCVPDQIIGDKQGTKCLCDNEHLCRGDGKGNLPRVTQITQGPDDKRDPQGFKCQNGQCDGSQGLTAFAAFSIGVAILVSYANLLN